MFCSGGEEGGLRTYFVPIVRKLSTFLHFPQALPTNGASLQPTMTQAFCALLLHYSVARLSWKTIKSLRRSRSRLQGDGTSNSNSVSAVEYEVLQGWTILAFHSLYVATGVEYFVRFFIPFYYYFKMIFLAAAFVVPWAGMKGGGGDGCAGLSPVISYCFDYAIVPGVHKMHELVDHDPKRWALHQLAMLPFRLIDWFVLPGVLATEEEKQRARTMRRSEEISQVPPAGAFPPRIIDDNVQSTTSEEEMPGGVASECVVMGAVMDIDTHEEKTIPAEDSSQSAPMDTDDNFSSVSNVQDSFARKYRDQKEEETKIADEPPEKDDDDIYATPSRRGHKKSAHFSTPPRSSSSLFPRRTPSRTKSTSKKSFNSMISPVMKSRLASSAMRLKKLAGEHRDSTSPIQTPRKVAPDATSEVAKAEETVQRILKSPRRQESGEDDEMSTSSRTPRRRRRERRSFGDAFREIVTGDANIRVRDHLFDLELPISPRRRNRTRPAEPAKTDPSNKATRRSTRLAKKKSANNS